mmetsp:Transcript_17033/g.29323  ORF Transcript_17033/g.29323 Transcript_17033/m.29323 type:complete len:147 (+) Transcript_17033:133-573(+)|eukprot:CAMPEP_0183720582 /NCGR_PEP_ID=MMETSP0737-20130205/13155_1 /TAXON_ID=385413 /ORGANISM="Thalassiosira miniscula, Strain CCMP1093" /LENGTH=146 /DNA_ID=CAMNT_0025950465 /DNA_START=106 /DNA_END=546 /DNA_ORIENTATION=-
MSEQPEATKPAEPKLCKMGCGFFGSNATGDCCSRCWATIKPKDDATNKKGSDDDSNSPAKKIQNDSSELVAPSALGMDKPSSTDTTATTNTADPPSPAKKKKKKASYKSMMAGMLEGNSKTRDVEKEKEKLKKVTGGGQFQKIDKI